MADMNVFGARVNTPSGADGVEGDPGGMYGAPSTLIRTGRLGGPGHIVPAYPTGAGGGRGSVKPPPQYPSMDVPSLPNFIMRQVMSPDNDHNTVANLKDTDLMGYARQYAETHTGAFDAAGDKMDKQIRDSLIDQFQSTVYNNLPKLRAALIAEEAKARGGAPAPTADLPTALGQHALGALQTGGGEALAGTPGVAANILMGPAKAAIETLMPGVANTVKEGVRSAVNPLVSPGAAALKKTGEENLQANADVLKEHPYLTTGAEIAGGVAPYLAAGALTGGAGAAALGMAQMGGANLEREQARISAMKPEELNALPEYKTLLNVTGDPEKAKALLAKASSEAAEEVGQLGGGVMGVIGGGGMTKPAQMAIAKLIGTNVFKRVLATATAEAGGFAGQQAAQNVLTTKATNKVTGEEREPDLLAGTDQAGIMGVIMGTIGALLHKPVAGKKGTTQPSATTPGATASGATPPPPGGGASSAGLKGVDKAIHDTLNDPDNNPAVGASPEMNNAVLNSALDDLEARLLGEGLSDADIAKVKASFEQQWRQKHNALGVKTAAPVSETGEPSPLEAEAALAAKNIPVQKTPKELALEKVAEFNRNNAKSPGAAIISDSPYGRQFKDALDRARELGATEEEIDAAGREATPAEEAPPGEAAPAGAEAAPVESATTVPEQPPEPSAPPPVSPGEARGALPEVPPASHREIAIAPEVDSRLPVGLLDAVVKGLRGTLDRDPTPDEINHRAHVILNLAGIDITDIHRREALGALLEEKPNRTLPTREEITKKAGELLDPRNKVNAKTLINNRMEERENHPVVRFRNVLRKTDAIEAEKRKAETAKNPLTNEEKLQNDLEVHREMLVVQAKATEEAAKTKTVPKNQLRAAPKITAPIKPKKGKAGAAAKLKSAVNNLKAKFARREPLGLYSAVQRFVDQAPNPPLLKNAASWKKWFDNAQARGLFKKSERQWLGIDAFLGDKQDITLADIQRFIKDSRRIAVDVQIGEDPATDNLTQQESKELYDFRAKVRDGTRDKLLTDEEWQRYAELLRKQKMAARTATWGPSERAEDTYDYVNWPGGEGYQERVLHEAGQSTLLENRAERDVVEEKLLEIRYASGLKGLTPELKTRQEALTKELDAIKTRGYKIEGEYQSPHFHWIYNPIGHTRGESRTAISGEKVQHISEFQAEAHQTAAQQGYRQPQHIVDAAEKELENIQELLDTVENKLRVIRDEYDDKENAAYERKYKRALELDNIASKAVEKITMYREQFNQGYDTYYDLTRKLKKKDKQYQELSRQEKAIQEERSNDERYNKLQEERDNIHSQLVNQRSKVYQLKNGIPDIPFKTPEEWVLALFKDRLKLAIESGQDAVSWTTGIQQTDRYAMGRIAKSISIKEGFGDNNFRLLIKLEDGRTGELTINKEGIVTGAPNWPAHHSGGAPSFVDKPLKYALGKAKADEVLSSKVGTTIPGDDVYIGPRFHRQTYDEVAPKVINDYVKQWGGKVVRAEDPDAIKFDIPHTSRQMAREQTSPWDRHIPHGETAVHSVKITPEMREAILGKDQAAFERAQRGGERSAYSLPDNLPTVTNGLSKLISSRVSEWHPGKEAKFEVVPETALPEDLKQVVSAFTRTGTRPVFVKNLTPHIEDFEGVAFGDRLLFIDEAANHPATAIVAHEFVHDLRANYPELYATLANEVKRQLNTSGNMSTWVENLKNRNYENVNEPGAIEELVANGAGDAFTDKAFLNELANRNPNVFRRIAQVFTDFINKLIAKLGGVKDLGSNKYLHEVDAFRNVLLDTLAKYDPVHSEVLRAQGSSLGERITPSFARREPIRTADEAHAAAKEWEYESSPLAALSLKQGPDTLEPSRWQRLSQIMSNTIQPLQHYNEFMARRETPVALDANMYQAFTVLRGRQIFEQSTDHSNYIAPFEDAIRQLSAEHDVPEEKLMAQFSKWIRARDALETNKRWELENIKLTPQAEAKRAPLLLAVRDGSFKGNYLQELKNIVYAPGAKLEKSVEPASGLSNVEAHKLLKDVSNEGFADAIGEQLNTALNPLRGRITENQLRAGSFSEADVRQQQAYEAKYYMPKSDWADEDLRVPQKVFGSPLGQFTKMAYEGHTAPVDDPLQRIFNKLLFSSKDVADNEATTALYNAAKDPNQQLGATIRTYDMDKLAEDALKGGNKASAMKRIAAGPNTVIHNRSKLRDVITLPDWSPQLQAIKESQNPIPLGGVSKFVGKGTGLYGRFHTAMSPTFAMVNAAVRDGLYIPGMMVFQGKLNLLPGYIGNYMRYGGPFGAWKAYLNWDSVLPRAAKFADIEAYAKEHPESFAGELHELEKAGGGFNFRDEFNNAKRIDKLRDEMRVQNRKPYDPRVWGKYLIDLQDAVATGSMMAGRVAAFRAAKAQGMTPTEAAFYSKRLLDYQQTSQGSRIMNSWFAFARVGVTSVDAMFSALKNDKGQIDTKRAAFGMMLMGVATASLYGALRSTLGDDKAKKLSDDSLAKNVVIPNGTDTPIQLPIGLGMPRLAWGISMLATRLAEGHTDIASAARTLKNLLLENVSPLHPIEAKEGADAGTNAADLAGALVPSLARPAYESFINQTAFGSQIHESPEYTQGYASEAGRLTTGDLYKRIARSLREHVGLDIYPETLRHIMSSYDPGVVNLLFKGLEKEDMRAAGLEVDASQATIFAALLNHDLKYAAGKEYYLSKLDLETAKKEKDVLDKEGKPILPSIQAKVDLDKEFVKASREHSKSIKAVMSNDLLSTTVRASRLAEIQHTWTKTQEDFSKQAAQLNH